MQTIRLRTFCVLIAAIGSPIGQSSVQATVQAIDSASFNLSSGGGTLTSITVGGTFLADLTGATSASTFPSATPPRFWNMAGGTDPLTSNVALSGLIATDGVLNANATFQFGRTLGLNETLFFMDLDSRTTPPVAEVVSIRAVDSTGTQIGDYQFTLPDSGGGVSGGIAGGNSYGPRLLTYTATRSNGADLAGFGLYGVSFTLADLVGTTGDLASATGFQVVDTVGGVEVDPTVGGIAAVLPPDTDFDDMNGTTLDDFHILRANYLTGTLHAQGDANGDSLVNHLDFFLWRTDFLFGGGSLADIPPLSVPEPSAVALVALGCLSLMRNRSRGSRKTTRSFPRGNLSAG